jgi:uncharacterized membrane protein
VDDVSLQSCASAVALGPDSSLNGLPGEGVVHNFVLANQSAASDSFALSVAGWAWPTALLSASPITLTAGATATLSVRVDVPASPGSMTDSFSLSAASVGIPGITVQAQGETSLDVQAAVALSADQQGAGKPGQVVAYIFTVTNTGAYTDTFTLEASGIWTATLPGGGSSGPLGAGESLTVILLVTIAEGALPGSSDVTVLTATSTLDGGVAVSAQATTVVFFSSYLPVVRK